MTHSAVKLDCCFSCLSVPQPMLHIRAHIYELEMWQKVKKLASLFTLATVQFEIGAYDIRNPAVGVAVEMGAHVSEDGVRHVWMGFHPSMCRSGQLTGPEGVSRDLLGPLRCVCHE